MANIGPEIRLLLSMCLFITKIPSLSVAVIRQRHFEVIHYCDVTAQPYDVTSASKSSSQCGVYCANDARCSGYVFQKSSGCAMYDATVRDQTACGKNALDAVRFYIQKTVCLNGGTINNDGLNCTCYDGYVGDSCERLMEDCSEGYVLGGYRINTEYWIHPSLAPYPFKVSCQVSSAPGYTQMQQKINENVDFNRTWAEYKEGIYERYYNFWIGNDKIHWITNSNTYDMITFLKKGNRNEFYISEGFVMENEANLYAVSYTSTSRAINSNMGVCWPGRRINFSTYDRDNDGNYLNCAAVHGAGFWYLSDTCTQCNLNGLLFRNTSVRLNIDNEVFWTPGLGNWSPDEITMALFRR